VRGAVKDQITLRIAVAEFTIATAGRALRDRVERRGHGVASDLARCRTPARPEKLIGGRGRPSQRPTKPVPRWLTSSRAASPMERTRRASVPPRSACSGRFGSCPASIRRRQSDRTGELDCAVRPSAVHLSSSLSTARMAASGQGISGFVNSESGTCARRRAPILGMILDFQTCPA